MYVIIHVEKTFRGIAMSNLWKLFSIKNSNHGTHAKKALKKYCWFLIEDIIISDILCKSKTETSDRFSSTPITA